MQLSGILLGIGRREAVCWRCKARLSPQSSRAFTSTPRAGASTAIARAPRLKDGYFLSNILPHRPGIFRLPANARNAVAPALSRSSSLPSDQDPPKLPGQSQLQEPELPHRRRQAARRNTASPLLPDDTSDNPDLPTNASTILTDAAARHQPNSLRRHLSALLSLSKPRLTVLIVLTAMAPYALYPVPSILSASALADAAPSLSPLTLLFLTAGTTLCSASANSFNMLYEPETDAKMSRTRNRPLVRALISPRAAWLFALTTGATGVSALYLGVNPAVSILGGANIFLYAGIYTPLKPLSALNTWAGALVGAIPPLMGWAAAAGQYTSGTGTFAELLLAPDSAGGWLLAALLFAWQFPHFMALSWGVRDEYRAAGLRMLAWVHPARNARVALRYSLVFVPLCVALCVAGVTEWSFAVTSLPANAWLVREAVRFWRHEGARGSARGLFWASVWHVPVIMVLALLQKKGMWQRVWSGVVGDAEGELDEDWEDVEEVPGMVVPAASQPKRP